MSSLAAGMAIGVVGDAGVRANAQQCRVSNGGRTGGRGRKSGKCWKAMGIYRGFEVLVNFAWENPLSSRKSHCFHEILVNEMIPSSPIIRSREIVRKWWWTCWINGLIKKRGGWLLVILRHDGIYGETWWILLGSGFLLPGRLSWVMGDKMGWWIGYQPSNTELFMIGLLWIQNHPKNPCKAQRNWKQPLVNYCGYGKSTYYIGKSSYVIYKCAIRHLTMWVYWRIWT